MEGENVVGRGFDVLAFCTISIVLCIVIIGDLFQYFGPSCMLRLPRKGEELERIPNSADRLGWHTLGGSIMINLGERYVFWKTRKNE